MIAAILRIIASDSIDLCVTDVSHLITRQVLSQRYPSSMFSLAQESHLLVLFP